MKGLNELKNQLIMRLKYEEQINAINSAHLNEIQKVRSDSNLEYEKLLLKYEQQQLINI